MELKQLLNRDIVCACGRVHRCDIPHLHVGQDALNALPEATAEYRHVLVAADENTWNVCGDAVMALLGKKAEGFCRFPGTPGLIPDENAIETLRGKLTERTDLILGIGSGVINDLCKYVSFFARIPCGIVATAPSMDGYASSGAAMISGGMKVTETTHAPRIIIGDAQVLCSAPEEMIRAGYGDIIGKYSALNDWELSALVNGEYLCPFVRDQVREKTDQIRALAGKLRQKDPAAVCTLTEALILIGACLTLLSTTRPGSGSEHHLSHYFEITGLIRNEPHFPHGIDVGYATALTAGLRERICKVKDPVFHSLSPEVRRRCYQTVYGNYAGAVYDLQDRAGRYGQEPFAFYRTRWEQIRALLQACPTRKQIERMLTDGGFDLSEFEKRYGKEKIRRGVWFAKDLKDRYSVLWLYDALFFTEKEAEKIR